MDLVSVAAIDDNRLIGAGDELPWPSLPADKRQYRERVAGHPVVLGRRTFEMMRDALPGSRQVVLSRSERSFDEPTATRVGGVDEALSHLEALDDDRAYVLGGAKIYDLFQPHVDRMVLSRVPGEYEGDTYFPDWDPRRWRLVAETPYENFRLEEYERV